MKMGRSILLLALLVLCWGRPSCGSCAETYTITEAQLLTLEENLAALSMNNAALLEALSASSTDLTEARSESEALRERLDEVERQLLGLRDELERLRSESQNAKESLTRANRELQSAVESVKTLERKRRRIERQRNLWEVVAVILGGIAVMR